MAIVNKDFIVKNGVIIEGDSIVTSSTNQTDALQVSGGAAIAKNLIVGTTASIYGNLWVGGEIVADRLTIQFTTVTTTLVTTDDIIRTTNPTDASELDTGALQIAGGGSFGGNLYVGGTILANSISGNALTANTATNIAGGAPGSIVYQTNTGTTGFIPIGTSTYVLTSDGAVPQWQSAAAASVGSASNLAGGATGYIPFQASADSTTFDGGNFHYNSSTKLLSVPNIAITGTTVSVDSTSGALTVAGGVGIVGDLHVGGLAYSNGSFVVTTASFVAGTDIHIEGISTTTLQTVTISDTSTLQSVSSRGSTTTQAISITNGAASTSTTTGALTVTGGVGIGGNLNVGGNETIGGNLTVLGDTYAGNSLVLTSSTLGIYFAAGTDTVITTSSGIIYVWNTSTLQSVTDRGNQTTNSVRILNQTNSTGTDSGALIVDGGVGIAQDLWVGGDAYVKNAAVITTATVNSFANQTFIYGGTDTAVSTSTGNITIWNTSTLQTVTDRGFTTTNRIDIINSTSAIDTTTGALTVLGGVGVQGNLYAGDIYSNGQKVLTGGAGTGYVSSILAGTDTAVSTTTGVVTVWNTSTLQSITQRGATTNVAVTLSNASASTTTVANNALYVAGGVGVETSLYVKGEAVFENNVLFVGTTTYAYSTNTIFTDNILELHNPGRGTLGLNNQWFANDGKDIGLRFHYYDTQDRNAFLGRANDTGYLEWYDRGAEGTDTFTGARYGTVKTGSLILVDTTPASNTGSGALQVAGGVGIGGTLYVQDLFVLGTSNVSSTGTVNIGNATATTIVISSTATIGALDVEGNVLFNSGLRVTTSTNSTSTITGAVVITGGVGIGKDVHIGGSITVGLPNDGVAIPAIYSNNVQLASYTSNVISGSSPVNLDQWSSTNYRTARYTVQIVDGNDVHVTELVVFHNGTNAYINEYGVTTSNGELGTFNATLIGGYVIMSFTPVSATAMTIKVVRFTITA